MTGRLLAAVLAIALTGAPGSVALAGSPCSPDGAVCDDGADCTSGETCSAGVCGGGTAVPGCIDMTGWWEVQAFRQFGMPNGTAIERVTQRNGVVSFSGSAIGPPWVGTIDASGVLDLTYRENPDLCGTSTFTGVVAADGGSFTADFTVTGFVIARCGYAVGQYVGTRTSGCGDGTVDPGELCDDGNDVSDDGCDVNCTPTGCGNGVRTGREICDDGNGISGDGCDANCRPTGCNNGIVSPGETCDDGNSLPGDGCDATCQVEPCWSCAGAEPSLCAPPIACAHPRDARRAKLVLRRQTGHAERNAIGLRSGATDPIAAAALGDPRAGTDYRLCLFDRSGAKPKLLFNALVPGGGTCGTVPCWDDARGGFAYRDATAGPPGITKLLAIGDDGGKGGVTMVGRGSSLGLPALPLPVPLEFQLQSAATDGACWAVDLPAAGVQRNDAGRGRFSARGVP